MNDITGKVLYFVNKGFQLTSIPPRGVKCYFVRGRCVPKWKVLDVPFLGRCVVPLVMRPCTDKKEYQIFLIYKEIQSGVVVKSYMRKGFLIYIWEKCAKISPYMRRPLVIYDFATAPLWISLYMRKIWFYFLSVWDDASLGRCKVPRCGPESGNIGHGCVV